MLQHFDVLYLREHQGGDRAIHHDWIRDILALLVLQPLLLLLQLAPVGTGHKNFLALKQVVLLDTVL